MIIRTLQKYKSIVDYGIIVMKVALVIFSQLERRNGQLVWMGAGGGWGAWGGGSGGEGKGRMPII